VQALPNDGLAHYVSALTVDATNVYWFFSQGFGTITGLYTCKRSECGTKPAATVCAETVSVPASTPGRSAAANGSSIFWTGANTIVDCSPDKNTYRIIPAPSASAVAADTTELFWVHDTFISKCSLPSCDSPIQLATGQSPANLAMDVAAIYWVNADGSLMKLAR
jgi:hypothetical protein